MRNRSRQRELRKSGISKQERLMQEQKLAEELLDRYDFCGIQDLTPYEAVKHIVFRKDGASAKGT